MVLVGLSIGLVGCGDDGGSSPETTIQLKDVQPAIVELDGNVWALVGDKVIEFDGATHEQLREVDLGTEYSGVLVSDGEVVWASGVYGLTRIDPATGDASTTEAAYDSLAIAAGRLFAAGGGDLYEVDRATGAALGQVTLPLNENGFDYEVVYLPLVGVGDTLWVTVAEDDFSFTAFDATTGAFGAKVEVDESFGSAVLVGDVIWLADRYGNAVIADAATGEVLDEAVELPIGDTILDEAGSLFAGPDDTLWLHDQPAQDVYQLDPHTGTVLNSFHLSRRPSAMTVTATELWFTNPFDDSITVLARTSLKAPAQS